MTQAHRRRLGVYHYAIATKHIVVVTSHDTDINEQAFCQRPNRTPQAICQPSHCGCSAVPSHDTGINE